MATSSYTAFSVGHPAQTGTAPRAGAMGALCRIGGSSKQVELDLSLAPPATEYAAFIRRIWASRREVCSAPYPEVSGVEGDPYDRCSCVIYTQDACGRIGSTARIAFDGKPGIPEATLVPALVERYHRTGIQFAELGRFIIDDEARGVLGNYYRAYYELGRAWGIEVYPIARSILSRGSPTRRWK